MDANVQYVKVTKGQICDGPIQKNYMPQGMLLMWKISMLLSKSISNCTAFNYTIWNSILKADFHCKAATNIA